jgi:predicted aldo/keto reductase-like oxidoreductase
MKKRPFGNLGIEVSPLGFGCMRLPLTNPEDPTSIDEQEAIHMIRHAIDEGVNYVDTAYPYHAETSELLVGKALKDGYREKVYLATKSPVWKIQKPEDFDTLLAEQLMKLQTDHIDFYLLHALSKDRWENIILKYDLLSKMEAAKADGRIKYIGFSFHDDHDVFMQIVNGYDKWDFCQIQLNYINTDYQAGIKGLEYAAGKGMGVIIMEPLLGGKLADPAKVVKEALSPKKTPVEWALDFLWNRKEVSLLLSGMSSMAQTEDNLTYAKRSSIGMLSSADLEMLKKAKTVYDSMALVPCTKCEYCMPCPFGLNIPTIFEAYNQTAAISLGDAKKLYDSMETGADSCRKCKRCEKVCPQHIAISETMSKISEVFK